MTQPRTPPTLGIAACVLILVLVALPYLLLSEAGAGGIAAYYDHGGVGLWVVTILTTVALVAFAAGRQGRSDPVMMAGATLVFGLFILGSTLVWALSVPAAFVQQLGTETWLGYHRWALVGLSALVPIAGVWYAVTLDVL
ncbi:DUF7548 family protein [Natranaeroarchaeum aerophilus]|uniref:Uncharacterized protein n=1 Tax=Natranaeroarchaeum aerophilus TaxID=2917711 RepID=A0AAE3K7J4_9EURY|nr:hypothetical protein [Natranaeroarchaeum aerophilus]MCL9813974.1 hypothetical protein [Natranaeroarchaeum aerophilus]